MAEDRVAGGWGRRLLMWSLLGVVGASGQTVGRASRHEAASGTVSAGAAGVLMELGSRAGVIFAGQVVAVSRNDDAGFVDVEFAVEQPVRGCGSAKTYVLREWAGLWTGQDRYEAGQRLLMLLAGRGPSGMSAPVGGMAGALPIVAARMPPLVHGAQAAPAETAAEASIGAAVDLRWVEALEMKNGAQAAGMRVGSEFQPVRGPGAGSGPGAGPGAGPGKPPVPAPAGATGPSLSVVLALLGQR